MNFKKPVEMKTHELDSLIDNCIEGCLSDADAAMLSRLIEESPEVRARYWEAASVHGLLEDSLQQATLRVITGQQTPAPTRVMKWFYWRPWTAAAAGLVFGIFSASMVWAYAVPMAQQTLERTIEILTEGFEDSEMTPPNRFPKRADEWSGDMSSPVAAEADVAPSEGIRMMRLTPGPTRKLGYAWRIVDLEEHPEQAQADSRRLEVSASFNTPGEARQSRYQIRLAAFSQEPGEVRQIWNNELMLFDTVLQHVGRNVLRAADHTRWQTVHASMEIPPGTRSVVISLAAGAVDSDEPPGKHYLDDVRVRFVLKQSPLE